MPHIPTLLYILSLLGQAPESAAPAAEKKEAAAAEKTDAEKFLEESSGKIDAIASISAKLRQTIHAAGQTVVSTGVYARGPDQKARFQLEVDLATTKPQRVHACDGKTCFYYEKVLDKETLETFDAQQVLPLLEEREIPEPARKQLSMKLPFVKPGDMLRGYLKEFHFDKMSQTTLGKENPRLVTLLEGSWRKEMLGAVSQGSTVNSVEDLPGTTPQYVRLYLDKETRFPLRIELFRKDKEAEYKPVYVLEFLEVDTQREIPASEFTFRVPESVTPVDTTKQLVDQLEQLPKKK